MKQKILYFFLMFGGAIVLTDSVLAAECSHTTYTGYVKTGTCKDTCAGNENSFSGSSCQETYCCVARQIIGTINPKDTTEISTSDSTTKDAIESRELPSEVTEMIQNSSTSVSSEVLPAEVTDMQRAAAEEYATTTSPTERATILGTTGLTNDQLMSIALDNDGTTSPDAPMGSVTNNGVSVLGGTGGMPSAPSPAPSASSGNGASTENGNTTSGATNSNRADMNASGAKPNGLYIPTKADTGLSDMSVTNLIRNLMQWLLYIVGFVAIIAFVISGIQYLFVGASEEMAKKAKANMQYAMIGVIVALSALIIIRAVQAVLSGASIF